MDKRGVFCNLFYYIPFRRHLMYRIPKKIVYSFLCLSLIFSLAGIGSAHAAISNSGAWTWVDGSKAGGQNGAYGTEDVPDANNVPGVRNNSVSWTDSSGNLWLFGGEGRDKDGAFGSLNDLWKFDPAIGQWTWVDGSNTYVQSGTYGTEDTPDANNVPGARQGSASWIDGDGNLWLFGGNGRDGSGTAGRLNDLWKFNPATGQWTWVDGSNTINQNGTYGTEDTPAVNNVPGARQSPTSWIDGDGNLWLFGGYGRDSGGTLYFLNDLWKFTPATGQWTWVDGSNVIGQAGVYGTEDTPAANNVPGARLSAASWIDGSGNLWLFGGNGLDSGGTVNGLNDLWKFDPTSGQWTWVDGSTTVLQSGTYGMEDVASVNNIPGARQSRTSWVDASGNFWLFGGFGRDSAGNDGNLNDLWKFDPATQQWTWVDGSITHGQSGIYGTEDVPAASNVPGGRYVTSAWVDANDNLWLFGGFGQNDTGVQVYLNDLWKFNGGSLTVKSAPANDGWILESAEASNAGGSLNSAATTIVLGDDGSDREYRAILHFDTSALPDNAVVTNMTLKIKQQGSVAGANPFSFASLYVDMRNPAFGSSILEIVDFNFAAKKIKSAVFNPTPASGWYSARFNNGGNLYVSRTGVTQLRLYFSTGDNNNSITDFIRFYSGNAAAGDRPKLIITYSLP
jgi:N-acetylneuraminic acid mutarotase